MATKLYVGGLAYSTTDDALKAEFEKAGGVVSVNIIKDRDTGNSKGFGFVEMESDEAAKKAVEMFNGQEVDGRRVRVDEARPMAPRD
jgi:cold-inducible RNA-binding protein